MLFNYYGIIISIVAEGWSTTIFTGHDGDVSALTLPYDIGTRKRAQEHKSLPPDHVKTIPCHCLGEVCLVQPLGLPPIIPACWQFQDPKTEAEPDNVFISVLEIGFHFEFDGVWPRV